MRNSKVQQLFGGVQVDDRTKTVAYTQSVGYTASGEVVYDNVRRQRWQNGSGFVISYTEKISEFLSKVSTGSIVRVFLYIAHHQSYGQNGQFGFRCSHRHIEQALRLDRTTVWDALKFLKDKSLVVENRVDGCTEFMVNPSYITIGADKKAREREWIRRRGGAVVDNVPSSSPGAAVFPSAPSPGAPVSRSRRLPVDSDMN